MARKKASKGGLKLRSTGLVGAVAVALAGGGYYLGKNGPPLPEKIAALMPAEKPSAHPAHEAKAPEAPSVKTNDKAELSKLLKGAEAKLIAAIRPEAEKRAKVAKTEAKSDAAKAEAAKAEAAKEKQEKAEKAEAKADAAKAEAAKAAAKAQAAKAQLAKADAKSDTASNDAPLPPARIPDTRDAQTASVDAAPTATIAKASQPEAKPAAGAPLVASLTGKGIPTSEDSKMRLSVGFSNRTGKPIRAFEGVLKFTDRSDHSLYSSKISVSALIAEGGSINWDERVDPDKLDAKARKLVDADKDSLKAVFAPKKIFFVDGSVQQFGAKDRVALR